MADIYSAQLNPGKLDVVTDWVAKQGWAAELDLEANPLEAVTAYRFDDPAGEVGIEIHIVKSGDQLLQVPLTYRGAPLEGADEAFVANMEHSCSASGGSTPAWATRCSGSASTTRSPLHRPRRSSTASTTRAIGRRDHRCGSRLRDRPTAGRRRR